MIDELVDVTAIGLQLSSKHLDNLLVGTTVKRAPESTDAGGERSEEVGLGTADKTDSGSGAVELVINVKDQQLFHDRLDVRIDFVVIAEHHLEQSGTVREAFFCVDEIFAGSFAVAESDDRQDLTESDRSRFFDLLRGRRVGELRIVSGETAEHGADQSHRVSAFGESIKKFEQLRLDLAVLGNACFESGQLIFGRILTVNGQVNTGCKIGLSRKALQCCNHGNAGCRLRR